MRVELFWFGKRYLRGAANAQQAALRQAAEDAAARARATHPGWRSQTGGAERSIRADPVRSVPGGYSARFGLHVRYGIQIDRRDQAIERARDRAARALPRRIKDALAREVPAEARLNAEAIRQRIGIAETGAAQVEQNRILSAAIRQRGGR